jgi:hypothetical protein
VGQPKRRVFPEKTTAVGGQLSCRTPIRAFFAKVHRLHHPSAVHFKFAILASLPSKLAMSRRRAPSRFGPAPPAGRSSIRLSTSTSRSTGERSPVFTARPGSDQPQGQPVATRQPGPAGGIERGRNRPQEFRSCACALRKLRRHRQRLGRSDQRQAAEGPLVLSTMRAQTSGRAMRANEAHDLVCE